MSIIAKLFKLKDYHAFVEDQHSNLEEDKATSIIKGESNMDK